MKIIGIDIGTTSVCGVLIDAVSGKLLNSRQKNSEAFLKGCAEWEKIQSVEKIIAVATEILDALFDEDVVTIGVTGQMHGIVYTNKEGEAVSPLYTWQDGRGNLPYKDTTYAKYLNSFSGYGNVTDFYNCQNGIKPKNAESYCTIQDYLVMQLCGLKKPLIHASDAASFGCYDIIENTFDYDCNLKVTADYCIAGRYQGVPVAVAIGDNQASVFSTLADESKILINIGTGSQVSVISNHPVVADNIETRPYFDGKYLVVGSALCGGRAYSILKEFFKAVLGSSNDDAVYARMAEMSQDVTLTMEVDTRFAGTRSDKTIKGSIQNITEDNFTPGQLTVGVLDGVTTELYHMYQEMKLSKSGIVGSGNGVRKNPILIKRIEEKFQGNLLIPAHMEEAAFGAALYAGISADVFSSSAQAKKLIQYIQ